MDVRTTVTLTPAAPSDREHDELISTQVTVDSSEVSSATLTAELIAAETGEAVWRFDLSSSVPFNLSGLHTFDLETTAGLHRAGGVLSGGAG